MIADPKTEAAARVQAFLTSIFTRLFLKNIGGSRFPERPA
jgi:hypothetical protein